MSLAPALRDATFRWIADDPDQDARAELQGVLARAIAGDQAAVDELTDRMAGPLTFGTAGLRGPVRAGANGMNEAVVVRTTAGLADWLQRNGHGGGVVVVGRDARHGSELFHRAAAGVLAAAGFDVRVLDGPLPTPVTAFLVRELNAVAGVQITASHNPPADNGYKLYIEHGAQIVPPTDRQIEAAIAQVPAAVSVPRSQTWTTVSADEVAAYVRRAASLPTGGVRTLRVAATPMHGVGAATLAEVLAAAEFTDVHFVAQQQDPDPDFPTVSFPNPEEPGATDLLLALAAEVDADLAIALDPDADRCALGVRERDGSWRMLRGDETGVLLGEHVLSTMDATGALVATTIVSSSLLSKIAAAHGARYDETLTGFKWLVRAGDGAGTGLVYAYEEALGHCVDPDYVRDKDGISAAVLACDLAAGLKAEGRTPLDVLDDLAVAHGLHLTDQVSLRVTELSRIGELMAKLRTDPPTSLAGGSVSAEDLRPRADVLALRGEGVRVLIRPSGTEPKLKAYLEIVEPVPDRDGLAAARQRAVARLATLRGEVSALFE
ncbi:phospho-sugar mutase [Kutzneria sp. CA-103260]|uniref:phospho-sugar mutase n=1 Tax=Kutzneria sp. CA-103260 TaxID=2802641 RepID=UPI001BA55B4A|nr:phospho-sugar mutase [Kutzneria sp. CA-103260]QUQ70857.1 phosphoglucomutase [Kutzneria sp. CA-103260]